MYRLYRKLCTNMENICLYLHKEINKKYIRKFKKWEGLVSNRVVGTEMGVRLSILIFICEM